MKLINDIAVSLPQNLADVMHSDAESETNALASGLSQAAIDDIWRSVENVYRSGAFPAVTFCLRRNGHIVLNRSLGHASGNAPKEKNVAKVLATAASPVCFYSASKAVTAILAHILAEQGEINLADTVAKYIPEFAQNGKGGITVSQLLAHRAGLPTFDLPKEEMKPELLLQWDRVLEVLCQQAPAFSGKPRMAYHAITGGYLVGEIIRRVTGKDIRAYLDETIRQPMGMEFFNYGLAPEKRHLNAKNAVAGTSVRFPVSTILEKALGAPINEVVEIANQDIFMDAIVPAGNMYGTAEELSRFYQMLLNGGEYNGRQIMRPETVKRAVAPAGGFGFDRSLMAPMRYSEGLMLGANPVGIWGPNSDQSFGHIGFMNILGWGDPRRKVSVGMLVSGKAVLGPHLIEIGRLMSVINKYC